VRFSRGERVVELVRGQAYFEVAHEARRFRVDAAGASVVATGTEFNVDRSGQSVTVTMIDGQVAVVPTGVALTSPGEALQGAVNLSKGQQMRLQSGAIVAIDTPADVSASVAWLKQQIVFDRRPLSEVAEAFNRYSSVRIEVADPELRNLQISGVFNSYDTDSFLTFIETLDGLAVERSPQVNRVVRRQQQ
jgi:transmembrane sensor